MTFIPKNPEPHSATHPEPDASQAEPPYRSQGYVPIMPSPCFSTAENRADLLIAADGRVSMASPTIGELLTIDPRSLTGTSIRRFVDGADAEWFDDHLEKTLQGDGAQTIHLRLKTSAGEPRRVRLYSVAVPDVGHGTVARTTVTEATSDGRGIGSLEHILDSIDEGIVVIDRDFRILAANRAYCDRLRVDTDQIVNGLCFRVSHGRDTPCNDVPWECPIVPAFADGLPHEAVHTHYDGDGEPHYVEIKAYPLKDPTGRVVSVVEILKDITEKVELEAQLRHAQKMEAVGQLAGGIAHDFNNLLTAILGYGDLLRGRLGAKGELRDAVDEILSASTRATRLTRSLLAFCRKQQMEPAPVGLNEIVETVAKLLRRVLGEDLTLDLHLGEPELTIRADRFQIEQVLMNLATNARDAMPNGGTLTIETQRVCLDSGNRRHLAGPCALLTVRDTGAGMTERESARVFEPFFTTKEVGKGTGLGLAVVYGIVTQHDGHIEVDSAPGKGATFRIYLPLGEQGAPQDPGTEETELPRGHERILVAEDDLMVRTFITQVLREFGYQVIEAVDGIDAVEQFRERSEEIDLVIMDVVMPRRNGDRAFGEIQSIRPGTKVLFISGYSPGRIPGHDPATAGAGFLAKPISLRALLERARAILDAPATPA